MIQCKMFLEIARVQQTGRIPLKEQKYVDIYREKQIRVTVKVLVPVKEHPKVRQRNAVFFLCLDLFIAN